MLHRGQKIGAHEGLGRTAHPDRGIFRIDIKHYNVVFAALACKKIFSKSFLRVLFPS